MVLPITPPGPLSFKTPTGGGGAGGARIQGPGPAAPPWGRQFKGDTYLRWARPVGMTVYTDCGSSSHSTTFPLSTRATCAPSAVGVSGEGRRASGTAKTAFEVQNEAFEAIPPHPHSDGECSAGFHGHVHIAAPTTTSRTGPTKDTKRCTGLTPTSTSSNPQCEYLWPALSPCCRPYRARPAAAPQRLC